jgi:hypothetical protein
MVILERGERRDHQCRAEAAIGTIEGWLATRFEPPGGRSWQQKKAKKRRRERYYLHEVCFMHRGRASLGSMEATSLGSMEATMNGLIYIVGLIVVVMVVLSLLGLR